MTPREILLAVYELLSDPARWTQGAPGRDARGRNCSGASAQAVSWCLIGAVSKCALGPDGFTYPAWREASERLSDVVGGGVATFNDTHTHREVLTVVRMACM